MWEHNVSCMTYSSLTPHLNKMGKEGWQLVSLVRLDIGEWCAAMKRPLNA